MCTKNTIYSDHRQMVHMAGMHVYCILCIRVSQVMRVKIQNIAFKQKHITMSIMMKK